MFNKTKTEIAELKAEIQNLKQKLEYWETPIHYMSIFREPKMLTGSEVMRRFEELYQHLGIEREIVPATSEHPKLTKKPKVKAA